MSERPYRHLSCPLVVARVTESHVSGDALDTKNVACFFCSADLPRPS